MTVTTKTTRDETNNPTNDDRLRAWVDRIKQLHALAMAPVPSPGPMPSTESQPGALSRRLDIILELLSSLNIVDQQAVTAVITSARNNIVSSGENLIAVLDGTMRGMLQEITRLAQDGVETEKAVFPCQIGNAVSFFELPIFPTPVAIAYVSLLANDRFERHLVPDHELPLCGEVRWSTISKRCIVLGPAVPSHQDPNRPWSTRSFYFVENVRRLTAQVRQWQLANQR